MRTLVHALLVATSCVWFGCAGPQTTPLTPTSANPAAVGQVETRKTENENTAVRVEAQHLAPPHVLADGARTYVVWTQALGPDAVPQNVGAMNMDDDRKASLETKTPLDKFELFITPEANRDAAAPSNDPVLKAKVVKR